MPGTLDFEASRNEELRRYIRARLRPGYFFRYRQVARELEIDMSAPANRQRLSEYIRDEGWAADCKPDEGYILSSAERAPTMAVSATAKVARSAERSYTKIGTLIRHHGEEVDTDGKRKIDEEHRRVSQARTLLRASLDESDKRAREARKLAKRKLPPAMPPLQRMS